MDQDGRDYVVRTTRDQANFSSLVEGMRFVCSGQAFIVNRQVLY